MSNIDCIEPGVSVRDLPSRYLIEHLDTISSMAFGGLKSILPFGKKDQTTSVDQIAKPPSEDLLVSYRQWCHVNEPYGVPAHLVCAKLAMPVIAKLTAKSPYPLLSVLNQGVKLRINKPIDEGEEIYLSGHLVDASDDGYRARIESRVEVGTQANPDAVIIDAIAAVPLKTRPNKKKDSSNNDIPFTTIARWQPSWNEGQTFFYLTGDFNPIHTLPWFAKRTQFKGCIMHGYGAFAQAFEALKRSGEEFDEIEARFVRPLPLPGKPLLIQKSTSMADDNTLSYRIQDDEGLLYQVGKFRKCDEVSK